MAPAMRLSAMLNMFNQRKLSRNVCDRGTNCKVVLRKGEMRTSAPMGPGHQASRQRLLSARRRCQTTQKVPVVRNFFSFAIRARTFSRRHSPLLRFSRCQLCVAGSALWILWRIRSTFVRSSIDFMAGAALLQFPFRMQILRQAQHFRKAMCRFRGRHSTFAR